ncbi:MAG TPA: peptide-methionine (S)-S-oxide reductase MsrA [Candidatus Obscuribacterales bacterium]
MHRLSSVLIAVSLLAWLSSFMSAATAQSTGAKTAAAKRVERALFAAGCFWKTQYIFSKVPGVIHTEVGYTGGTTKNPSYEQVCSHQTGHAETTEVEFDPSKVSYQTLLKVFFEHHDPTTLNRQGPDVGTNYRSAIFCTTPEQKKLAMEYKEQLEKQHKFPGPITTVIQDAGAFYPAEDYHQDYFVKHGEVCN